MASAHAKFTGELGVCIATSGPGASHLITGLYDARLDHMPVLAIAGQQARTALGGHYQQEVDLPAMFKDVAGAFVQQAVDAGAGAPPGRPRRAHRHRRAPRSPRSILPNDLQELPYEEPPRKHGTVHSGVGYTDAAGRALRSRPAPRRRRAERRQEGRDAGRRRRAAARPTR